MRSLGALVLLAACCAPPVAAAVEAPADVGPQAPDKNLPLVGRSARSDTFRPRSPGGRARKAWKRAKRGGKR